MGCCGSRNWNVDELIQVKVNGAWTDAKVMSVTGTASEGTDVYEVWVGGAAGSRHTVAAANTQGRQAELEYNQ